jgi:micrococcal nuclease
VHPGRGRNTATDLYWGLDIPIFENATGAPTYMGDGGYLFDPQGDLRAWQQYP